MTTTEPTTELEEAAPWIFSEHPDIAAEALEVWGKLSADGRAHLLERLAEWRSLNDEEGTD